MAIQTLEDLADLLDGDLGWRRRELSALFFAVEESSGENRSTCVRAAVAMLYAHWEGFVKSTAEAYLSFVAVRRLPCSQLSREFRGLAYSHKLQRMNKKDYSQLADIIDGIMDNFNTPTGMKTDGLINTRANLNYDTFYQIMLTIGLDVTLYESKQVLIDEKLLRYRNNIAHGRLLAPDYDSFKEMRDSVMWMLEHLCVQTYEAAAEGRYRGSGDGVKPTADQLT